MGRRPAGLGADQIIGDGANHDVDAQGHDGHGEKRLAHHRSEEDTLDEHTEQSGDNKGGENIDSPLRPFGKGGQIAAGKVENSGKGDDEGKAPNPVKAPWAKLITEVALKMITNPMAKRA